MTKYTLGDIKRFKAEDVLWAIRARAYMYSRNPRNPLENIIAGITDEFARLDVSEHRVRETSDFFIIFAKQDWLGTEKPRASVEEHFNKIISPVTFVNGVRSEVLLSAFYFPFYTNGPAGELGDFKLLDSLDMQEISVFIGTDGRVLIISKNQNLPKSHGICFDQAVT